MKFIYLVKLYIVTLLIFVVVDFLWLTVYAQNFYQSQIGFILSRNPNLIAAGIFYLIFIAGLLYFVVLPSLKAKKMSLDRLVMAGAFFGLVTYATYDLTNYSTITNWPLLLVVVDMLWGAIISSGVASLSFLVGKRIS